LTPARHDLYRDIHKLIRKLLFDTSVLLGSTDLGAAGPRAEAWAKLEALFDELAGHATVEEVHLHPLIEARAPALARDLDADHATLDEAARAIARAMRAIDTAPLEARRALGDELYASFNLYVADQLRHMQREEREAGAVLQRQFSDEQLAAVTARIIASHPPEVAASHLAGMLGVVHPEERALIVARAKHNDRIA
jgi:hypothetical protein